MRITNLFKKMLLVVIMITLSMSVDAQYNRRAGNNTNGTSVVEEAANGVINGVKSLFGKKKDKSNDDDKKKEKKNKNKNKNNKKDSKNKDSNEAGGYDFDALMSNDNSLLEDDIEVIASADGMTKEQATLSALRSALEQTYGTFVSSNTQILNDELVKDEIVSISSGNIKHFDYLSESEINGKNYVTIKAIVSIGRLVTYAKSKGSSAELAGASFAMNVKMARFKADNIMKAFNNIQDEAFKILPYCLDFEIEEMSEPTQNRSGNFDVKFNVMIRFNENAHHLSDLAEQLGTLLSQYDFQAIGKYEGVKEKTHSLREVLPYIFDQFKIVDNINEMCFTDTLKEVKLNGMSGLWYMVHPIVTPNNKNKTIASADDVARLFCDERGMTVGLDQRYYGSDGPCIEASNMSDVNRLGADSKWYDDIIIVYKRIRPSRPFMCISLKFSYTLEELEKITGIDIVLR